MLKRETQKQLLRDLLARSAAPADQRRTASPVVGFVLLFGSVALYWLTRT